MVDRVVAIAPHMRPILSRRGWRGPAWGMYLAVFGLTVALSPSLVGDEPVGKLGGRKTLWIEYDGTVTGWGRDYLFRHIAWAQRNDVARIVLEIDSPGGELLAAEQITDALRGLSDIQVVAYVPHQALSAAAVLCLACDSIAMAPGARIGDAGPIFLADDFMFRHAPEKIRSDLVSRVRGLAEETGRPPALAEAMVDMDAVVHWYEHATDGRRRLATETEIAALADRDAWNKSELVLESQAGRFLELTGKRAKELGLIEFLVGGRQEVLDAWGIAESDVPVRRWTVRDTAVTVLNHSVITVLLLILGIAGVYIEFMAPGLGVGGLLSITSFSLFFWSRMLGGTAEWLEVVLFLVGLALLAVEVLVLPGFGVWGITGLLCVTSSLILAGQSFVLPQTPAEWRVLMQGLVTVLGVMVASFVAGVSALSHLQNIPFLSQFLLSPDTPLATTVEGHVPAPMGGESVGSDVAGPQVGDIGTVESTLRPGGQMRLGAHTFDVHTSGEFVPRGARVAIVAMSASGILVRRIG